MFYGVDYYPEHWSKARWETDAAMMRDAGINLVRMGEFAWALFEPREGRYEFDWLDEALDVLGRQGISNERHLPRTEPTHGQCHGRALFAAPPCDRLADR